MNRISLVIHQKNFFYFHRKLIIKATFTSVRCRTLHSNWIWALLRPPSITLHHCAWLHPQTQLNPALPQLQLHSNSTRTELFKFFRILKISSVGLSLPLLSMYTLWDRVWWLVDNLLIRIIGVCFSLHDKVCLTLARLFGFGIFAVYANFFAVAG